MSANPIQNGHKITSQDDPGIFANPIRIGDDATSQVENYFNLANDHTTINGVSSNYRNLSNEENEEDINNDKVILADYHNVDNRDSHLNNKCMHEKTTICSDAVLSNYCNVSNVEETNNDHHSALANYYNMDKVENEAVVMEDKNVQTGHGINVASVIGVALCDYLV
eukprot:Awhi_evm1s7900